MANPYKYDSPNVGKLLTLISPDIFKGSSDKLRNLIGYVFENIVATDGTGTADVDPETVDISSSDVTDGLQPQQLSFLGVGAIPTYDADLLSTVDTDDVRHTAAKIDVPHPMIGHAQMATARIAPVSSEAIIPNFKIPMRLFGTDPDMLGGDVYWHRLFAGGEYNNVKYESLIDNSTIFYDQTIATSIPYSQFEEAILTPRSSTAGGTLDFVDGRITHWQGITLDIEPNYVHHDSKIDSYIKWVAELPSERQIPNYSVYESLIETQYSYTDMGGSFYDFSYDTNRITNQIGNDMVSYLAQYDISNSIIGGTIEDKSAIPISPYVTPGLTENPYSGQTPHSAKISLLGNVADTFHTPEGSWYAMYYTAESKYARNTGSVSNYLYHMTLNNFSSSVMTEVDKRNENIFFNDDYWKWTYSTRGPEPKYESIGFWPYHVKIRIPAHNASRQADEVSQKARYWLSGPTLTDFAVTHGEILSPWLQPPLFLETICNNNFSSKFLETLKEISDDNWSPASFAEADFTQQSFAMEPVGKSSLGASHKSSFLAHQQIQYKKDISTKKYRSVDYLQFLASIYNNPEEELNTNYMFMGGDLDRADKGDMQVDATHMNSGIHRTFNTRTAIATLNDTIKIVKDTFADMMQRPFSTDDHLLGGLEYSEGWLGDGEWGPMEIMEADRNTIRGFLDPNYRHSEVLAYRVEKVGGHTTTDQTNKNVIQNFYSINDPARFGTDNPPPLDYIQFYDTQVKYGEDYTYNVYAYVLSLGFKYRYGDHRLTRQLSTTTEADGTFYCLEFYDPLTMEKADQQYELGKGLQQDQIDKTLLSSIRSATNIFDGSVHSATSAVHFLKSIMNKKNVFN